MAVETHGSFVDPADEVQLETIENPDPNAIPALVTEGEEPAPAEEFDYGDDPEGTPETRLQERAPAPDAVNEELGGMQIPQAILDRLDRAESTAMQAHEELTRLRGGNQERSEVPEHPPKPREELTTIADLLEYQDWRDARMAQQLARQAISAGTTAAGEQRARGLFSKQAMGEGLDYDAMISKYIAPIEKTNPRSRELFSSQRDPAMARYSIAFLMEMTEKFGGDPVRAFREMRLALSARARGGQAVFDKIKQAEQRGGAKIPSRATRKGGSGTKTTTAADIDNMTAKQFIDYKARRKAQGIGG